MKNSMVQQGMAPERRGRSDGAAIGRGKGKWIETDFLVLLMTFGLVIFGTIMVFSASYYNSISEDGTPYSYLVRQLFWVAVGTAALLVLSRLDYRFYKALAWPGLLGSLVLLLLLFTPLGITRNHATRWLGVEQLPLTLMPAEIAKLALIIFIAWYFSAKPERSLRPGTGMLPILLIAGVFGGLVMLQPNMSTTMIIFGIAMSMMVFAGVRWRDFLITMLLGAGAAVILIAADPDGYRLRRVTSFLDPFADPLGAGYQVMQSLFAMGSGGVFGVGLGKSIQKNLHLPEAQNDFILAIIGEELGFVGILLLLLCYLVLIWKGFEIALRARDFFGMLLACGITSMLAIQVILNVLVTTSSMPPTGVILPFVSYGGNALLLFMSAMGILLNISRVSDRYPARESSVQRIAAIGNEERKGRAGRRRGGRAVRVGQPGRENRR